MNSPALNMAFDRKISPGSSSRISKDVHFQDRDLSVIRKMKRPEAVKSWLLLDRDSEAKQKLKQIKVYEYKLSHTRSVATISKGANIQLFQGSSLLRKKRNQAGTGELQEAPEISAQKIADGQRIHQIADDVLRIKKVYPNKRVEHTMSRRTKIKIKEKMMALYSASKYNFSFVTLTMLSDCPDKKAVQILNKFLTALRAKVGSFNYVWVAERQSNGRIHFHMIMDHRFEIEQINCLWTMQQYNAGLHHINFDRMQKNVGKNVRQLYRMGYDGWKKTQEYFNPVDVIKCKTIDGVSAYLTNYVIKNDTKMDCALWHCNRAVSKLFTKQIISKKIFSETGYDKRNKIVSLNKRTGKKKMYVNKTYVHQYGIINNIYNKRYYKKYLKELDLINSWILAEAEKDEKDQEIKQGLEMSVINYIEWQETDARDTGVYIKQMQETVKRWKQSIINSSFIHN